MNEPIARTMIKRAVTDRTPGMSYCLARLSEAQFRKSLQVV